MVSEIIVSRPQYIEQLNKWQSQTDLIKIVTGVRRCGKSKLFSLYQFDLIIHKIADDNQIININLEAPSRSKRGLVICGRRGVPSARP